MKALIQNLKSLDIAIFFWSSSEKDNKHHGITFVVSCEISHGTDIRDMIFDSTSMVNYNGTFPSSVLLDNPNHYFPAAYRFDYVMRTTAISSSNWTAINQRKSISLVKYNIFLTLRSTFNITI